MEGARRRTGGDGAMTRTVIAQGTFDILHPGHVHYLEAAAAMGDELYVIVARKANVDHKEAPICPATQRRDVVGALEAVDEAILGHDQHHDDEAIAAELERRGIGCSVRRASALESTDDEQLLSTRLIIDRILERRA